MTKILFNGHDFKFLSHLIEHCEESADYEVIMDFIPGHEMSHIEQSKPLLARADLIFCEWALGNAEWYSINKKPGQKLVIRLHHQEINLHFLYKIHWPNVDQIVFICPENMENFLHRFPEMVSRTSLIYNVIDCVSLDQAKLPGAQFNLGFIGTAPMRKSPHLAVELFHQIKQHDDRYMLYIKGKHPWEYAWLWNRPEERNYYQTLYNRINQSPYANSVVFDPHGNDMAEWFSKIGFILSTSEHEGSHQAVAEGMAAGSIPVIRNWAGADKLYPRELVVKTVDEAVNFIQKYQDQAANQQTCRFIRSFARENFDIGVIIDEYEKLFRNLLPSVNKPEISVGKPSRLSVIHVCFLSIGNQSGYEVRVIEETKALVKTGITVFIAAFFASKWLTDPQAIDAHREKLERMTGATAVFFPTDRYFDLKESDAMVREIDVPLTELAKLHDVKILHGQALYSAHHALRVAAKEGLKVVFDNHGVTPEETAMTGGNRERVDVLTRFEQETLVQADFRIFVSNRMNDFYREKYSFPNPLQYQLIPCCVRSNDFSVSASQRNSLRKEKGFENRLVILYLGTLSVWQWPDAMFGLFSQYFKVNPTAVLYLLIPSYDHPKVFQYIAKYRLPEESYLLEEVAHSEVGKIVAVADAGLLLREAHPVNLVSSPTKFGEYLASGLPVILTDGIGDYSGMAGAMKVGISVELQDNHLSEYELNRLAGFLSDVQLNRDSWAARCKSVAMSQLDWDFAGNEIKRVYSLITASPPNNS